MQIDTDWTAKSFIPLSPHFAFGIRLFAALSIEMETTQLADSVYRVGLRYLKGSSEARDRLRPALEREHGYSTSEADGLISKLSELASSNYDASSIAEKFAESFLADPDSYRSIDGSGRDIFLMLGLLGV